MSTLKTQDQGLIMLSQQDYLPILVESFLIDRKAQGLSPDTIELYTKKLKYFFKYCERQALTQVSQITSDFIRCICLSSPRRIIPEVYMFVSVLCGLCCIGSSRKRSCLTAGKTRSEGSSRPNYRSIPLNLSRLRKFTSF